MAHLSPIHFAHSFENDSACLSTSSTASSSPEPGVGTYTSEESVEPISEAASGHSLAPANWSCPNSPDGLTFLNEVVGLNGKDWDFKLWWWGRTPCQTQRTGLFLAANGCCEVVRKPLTSVAVNQRPEGHSIKNC